MNSAIPKESPLLTSLRMIWGVTKDLNDWMDEHIDDLKKSVNETISATGRVLEGAKFGFGLGYMAPVALTMTGQLLLGGLEGSVLSTSIALAGSAAQAVTFSNPIAVTCGAIGAIYFGWKALSEQERNAIVNRVTQAFDIGVELVKSFIGFLFKTMEKVFTRENIEALRGYLKEAAEAIGTTLSSITKTLRDKFSDAADAVSEGAGKASETVKQAAGAVSESADEAFKSATDSIQKAYDDLRDAVKGRGSNSDEKSELDAKRQGKELGSN